MKKLFITFIITLSILMVSTSVFAAPETVSVNDYGNTYNLIAITSPPNQKDSTFEQTYIVSGHGKAGTTVTLYWHDTKNNIYKKIYNKTASGSYEEATVTIGSSGRFMTTINLSQGTNSVLARASYNTSYQTVRMSITKYSYTIIDIIKSLKS